jgi:hypothetical protein
VLLQRPGLSRKTWMLVAAPFWACYLPPVPVDTALRYAAADLIESAKREVSAIGLTLQAVE